jgi:hypothetical protein
MSDESERVKMAAISGASHALKFREQNPHATEAEVLQHVSTNMDEILEKIDKEIQ